MEAATPTPLAVALREAGDLIRDHVFDPLSQATAETESLQRTVEKLSSHLRAKDLSRIRKLERKLAAHEAKEAARQATHSSSQGVQQRTQEA